EGGELKEQGPGKERQGTDISISELFFNTPARLKYVRSMRTESGKIIDIIQRMALACPGVSFRLTLAHSEQLHTKGRGNLKGFISDINRLSTAWQAGRIAAQDADFKITGHPVQTEVNSSNRAYTNLSVNKQHIRNFRLTQSIINAYHTLLAKDK